MLKSLKMGHKIKTSDYDEQVEVLRHELLQAQFALEEARCPVLLVIAGMDGAGKGALVQRLNEWMDPRGIETNTYWMHSDEEESRPYFWRYWRQMPARGAIGIFLGSWYQRPVQQAIDGELKKKELIKQGRQIRFFEEMLTDDGVLVIKLWLHIDKDTQKLQLTERAGKQQNPRVTDAPYEFKGEFNEHLSVVEDMISTTSTERNPWQVLDACNRNYREITAGKMILEAMQKQLQRIAAGTTAAPFDAPKIGKGKRLAKLDLDVQLDRSQYKRELEKWQSRLQDLGWQNYREGRSVVAVFEGWDAAGKGSAIRRVTAAVDPRLYKLVQFGAPTDEELDHHYLWRFWRHIQRNGRATLFDRSWYGRVLVERVEGFASEHEWQRAYEEINDFERQLRENGSIVLKFWIHISKEEQLARFEHRKLEPRKQHKITDEDWRNRDKWNAYESAVEDMLRLTDTDHAPWTLLAGNDKRHARIEILKTFCKGVSKALDD